MRKTTARFDALTGLRAIAAIMVFCFHFKKFWFNNIPAFVYRALNEFHIGVAIFFVLSGFLITYTYKGKPLQSKTEYLKYILIRLARIFPVYILILTLKYCSEGFPSFKNIFLNYTLLKGFSDIQNLSGIPQSWSLTVELTFYCLAPFIFIAARQKAIKPFFFIVPAFALLYLAGYCLKKLGMNKDSFLYDSKFLLDATFFGRFSEFYAGMLLALIIERKVEVWEQAKGIRATLIGILGIMLSCFIISLFAKDIFSTGTSSLGGILVRNFLLPVFISLLLYGLITEKNWIQRILASRLFVLLGNASYIFYLLHINYGYAALAGIGVFYDRNFILLWLVSIAGYLLFEKPVYNFLRKKILSLKTGTLQSVKLFSS